MAGEFVRSGYDVKALIELIVTSDAYRMRATSTSGTAEQFHFTGPLVRRLTGEQFLDAFRGIARKEPDLSTEEVRRVVRLANRAAEHVRQAVHTDGPQLLFQQEMRGGQNDVAQIDVDIRGVKRLWLVAVPRHKVLTRLEQLAAEHERVADQESEKPRDVIKTDKTVAGNADKVALQEKLQKQVGSLLEQAVWAEGYFRKSRTKDSLLHLVPDQVVAESNQFSVSEDEGKEPVQLYGKPVRSAISGLPLVLFSYDLEGKGYTRFTASAGLDRVSSGARHRYEFSVIADFTVRSSFLENDELMHTLGRPKRAQILTTRENRATTMQGLELTKDQELLEIIQDISGDVTGQGLTGQEVVTLLYRKMLGREPSTEEAMLCEELVPTQSYTEEQAADLIWSIGMLPEFQLIY
jgi:hypothetical protein